MDRFSSALSRLLLSVLFATCPWFGGIARAEVDFVLTVGDSMTEEYAFEVPFSAPDADPYNANVRNWVEILRIWRGTEVWFGGYEQTAFSYGDWRNAGHELNFGVPGFTVTNDWFRVLNADRLPPLPSVTDLADYKTRSALLSKLSMATVAVVLIGANDLKNDYTDIFNGTEASGFYTRIVNRIQAIHTFIRNSRPNLPVVICTVPDVGITPYVRQTYDPAIYPEKRASARAKILALANDVRTMALSKTKTVVADVHALTLEYEDTDPFVIDGTEFIKAGHPQNPPRYLFCKDGFHAGTALQARIANIILDGVNRATGQNHPLLTDREIVKNVLGLDSAEVPGIVVEQPAGITLPAGSAAVSFGAVDPGTSGVAKSFTIRNTGTADLTNLNVTSDGPQAAEFVVDPDGMASTLAPGSATTFTVTFVPGGSGIRTATLHVASNDPGQNPFDIAVTARVGPMPQLVIEQPKGTPAPSGGSRSFGTVTMPKKPSLVFAAKNTGNVPLSITEVKVTGPDAADFRVTAHLSAPIKPGKSKTFKVRFMPASPGAKTAILHITTNDPGQNLYQIGLSGTALDGRSVARLETAGSAPATMQPKKQRILPNTASTKSRPAGREPATQGASASPANSSPSTEAIETTWSLRGFLAVGLPGTGMEIGQGTWKLRLDADGNLYLEDESGAGFRGTYGYNDQAELTARIFPQSVEDYVHAVFGGGPGFRASVEEVDLDLRLADRPGRPSMDLDLRFTASLSICHPDANQPVDRKLTYDASATGRRE